MKLPSSEQLPVNLLAACFNNTTSTYKFYWFLSILQCIEDGKSILQKRDLFSRMISNAWYSVHFFRISFGKQDQIQKAIHQIKAIEQITIDEKKDRILSVLNATSNNQTERILWHFNRYVLILFLSPWFSKTAGETEIQNEKRIYSESKNFKNECLYSLFDDQIKINPRWINYLTLNIRVLKDYCFWNLALYLQSKNPNTPDLANKLVKPATRNSLTKQRLNFWDLVIGDLGHVKCIYTGEELTVGNYAIEHFVPYNFVSHDLIWNLIPADKRFNTAKSDKLPPLERYFEPFFDLQNTAVKIVRDKNPKNKFLEEYLSIFPELDEISSLSENFTREKFRERLQPLITIASNNGFQFLA